MTARVLVADAAVDRPVFPRGEIRLADGLASPDSAGDRGIVVEVSRL